MREPFPGLLSHRRRVLLSGLLVALLLLLGLAWPQDASSPSFGERLDSGVQRVLNLFRGPVRVGIQIGHLDAELHPDELANLRVNTGGHWAGVNEVDLNEAVAEHLKTSLELSGIRVDLLPATVPRRYRADLLVSLHADASPDETRRGYKSAYFQDEQRPQGRNKLESVLKRHIDEAYFYYSGLPDDDANVSGAMLEYYAFNSYRFRHSVARGTPALIVEMGYLSNREDMRFLSDPVNPAYALKQGIVSYLAAQGRLPSEK